MWNWGPKIHWLNLNWDESTVISAWIPAHKNGARESERERESARDRERERREMRDER